MTRRDLTGLAWLVVTLAVLLALPIAGASCYQAAHRAAIQCCLIVFKQHFDEGFHVSSDGTDDEWNEARDGCQVLLGYGLDFQLDRS